MEEKTKVTTATTVTAVTAYQEYKGFEEFGLSAAVLKGVTEAGFTVPSPIQFQAIPVILQGKDVVGQAQTGTGKTAAFGLPAIHALKNTGQVELLVIVPTRELASQISDELYRLGRFAGVKTVAVYGGQSISRQITAINRGANVITATPGRLLDHLRSGRLKTLKPAIVVLDEADEMLDMGFIEDIESIFAFLPKVRQTLMFSATMPPAIRALAKKILTNPVTIDVTPKELSTPKDITHRYYVIQEREREEALARLIDTEAPKKALIFCRTKKETDSLSTTLISRGYAAKALHGDMEQDQRNEAIDSFRKGRFELLIATDVAARGLDIMDVTHVFNYHIPFDPEGYIHRIGRTGRAGKKGLAITLLTPLEFKELTRIMEVSGAKITYEEIPSIHEAKKHYLTEFAEKILSQPIDDAAVQLIQSLSDELDATQLACKVVTMLLNDKKTVTGPSKIGLSAKEVERMLNVFSRRTSFKSKWSRTKPGTGGGSGSGGGGRRTGR
jgi:ATP-dependent RNA helicase DeaD